MWQRAFVLLPLAELRQGWVTPARLQAVAAQHIERMDVPADWAA